MKTETACETCELRGYSPEICHLHHMQALEDLVEDDRPLRSALKMGKTAALGAGVGVMAVVFGAAAAPVLGIKVAIELAFALKLSAGAGAAGAAINVIRKKRHGKKRLEMAKRKRPLVMPLTLKGS